MAVNSFCVAIIAHVDHGKTTMMDAILRQGQAFRENEEVRECIMDSDSIEMERKITIYAKVSRVHYAGNDIYVIDTPGHADFSAEVERVLSMCNGVLLLVDAMDGVMPQTKYVLSKALEAKKKVIVILNKIDRENSRPDEVIEEILELFIDLGAEDQIDFPVLYASGREGWCIKDLTDERKNLSPLFDTILANIGNDAGTTSQLDPSGPFKMLVSLLEYNEHFGRVLIGKVMSGKVCMNDKVKVLNLNNEEVESVKITRLLTYQGIKKHLADEAKAGDIIAVSGLKSASVADTICDPLVTEALHASPISPPVISVSIGVNTSPLAGKEGTKLTSRMIKDRLMREAESNVAISIKESSDKDTYEVFGRGELQLAILVENMRREGFELSVARPKPVFMRDPDTNKVLEPIETVYLDVDAEYSGTVINALNMRKGIMVNMMPFGTDKTRVIYEAPSRCLMGYHSQFLTDTRGEGVINRIFKGYEPYRGDFEVNSNGALISSEDGESSAYALWKLQERGIMFIGPQEHVYVGMVIGEHSRDNDLEINPTKAKQLSNMRASGSDEKIMLIPSKKMSLEEMFSYVRADELIEITPGSIRLRKAILNPTERKRFKKG